MLQLKLRSNVAYFTFLPCWMRRTASHPYSSWPRRFNVGTVIEVLLHTDEGGMAGECLAVRGW